MEILALYCLLLDSPDLLPDEDALLAQNQEKLSIKGREPNLMINTLAGQVILKTGYYSICWVCVSYQNSWTSPMVVMITATRENR